MTHELSNTAEISSDERQAAQEAYDKLVVSPSVKPAVGGISGTTTPVQVTWCALTEAAFLLGFHAAKSASR